MNRRQAKKIYKKIHGHNPPEGRIPVVLLRICSINKPKVNMKIMTREDHERVTIETRCFRKTMNNTIRRMNSRFMAMREKLKGNDDPIVITARRLSENRKKNKGIAWRRARRNR